MLYTINDLKRVFEQNVCIVYGAGKVGKTIIKFAARHRYRINKILVSSMQKNPTDVLGVSVVEAKEYSPKFPESVLIVGVMERLHLEIKKGLNEDAFKEIYFVSDELYREITYTLGDYEIELSEKQEVLSTRIQNCIEREIREKLEKTSKEMLKFVPRPCLEYMIVNILDHCNLKCKGCDHFACVADPYFVSLESIRQDVEKMAEIFHHDYINQIAIMGGEPLLHPELLEIIKIVRKSFPYTMIRLTTNGLLLLKQEEEFWKVCRENDVIIVTTKYPISLDFEAIKKKARRECVNFKYFEGTGDEVLKMSFKKIITLEGDADPVESFSKCNVSNYGNFLMEGKFYGCPFSSQSFRIFNKVFNQKLRLTEKDYLDIYKVKDMEEILEFCSKAKPYCRYCEGKITGLKWERTKKKMDEWVNL